MSPAPTSEVEKTSSPVPSPPTLVEKVGLWGLVKISGTLVVFLIFMLFYTILPIAGLQLLPFLFFGCVALIVGVCDDLGVYR